MEKGWLILLSIALFCTGLYVLLTRKHILVMLLGGELLLNAAALNFIVFGNGSAESQLSLIFLLGMGVSEAVLVLALSFTYYKLYGTMWMGDEETIF